MYLRGHPPWDTGVTPPEVVELVEGRDRPPGRAPDLGCGTGTTPDKVRALFEAAFALERIERGSDRTGPPSAWYWLQRRQ